MQQDNLSLLKDNYIESLKVRNLAKRTIEARIFMLSRFFRYLQDRNVIKINSISKSILLDYQTELYHTINSRGRPNSAGYQNSMLSAVKGFMKFLKERDYIVQNPSLDIPYAKVPKRLPGGILTATEARRIITIPDSKCTLGYRDRVIMEVLYTTGIRKQELNNLNLSDVDYHDGFLRIELGKGGKDRIVPVGKIACRYLENYIKSVRPELIKDPYNNALFLSTRGNRLSKNMVWEMVKKYARKAKIKKNISPHTFRHTCATAMLKNNADIRAVQELLGHESLESTQVYTRVTINDLKEVHRRCHPREKEKE